jgi:hypothetical protein
VPEFIDPVFTKTSQSIIENERFGLVFAKSRSTTRAPALKMMLKIGIPVRHLLQEKVTIRTYTVGYPFKTLSPISNNYTPFDPLFFLLQ